MVTNDQINCTWIEAAKYLFCLMHDLGRCFNLNSFGVRHDISMAKLVAILSCNPMKVEKNTGILFSKGRRFVKTVATWTQKAGEILIRQLPSQTTKYENIKSCSVFVTCSSTYFPQLVVCPFFETILGFGKSLVEFCFSAKSFKMKLSATLYRERCGFFLCLH